MKFGTAHRNGLKWVAPAAIGLAVSLVFGANAQAAEIRTSKKETRAVYLVKNRLNNTVQYNKRPVGKFRKLTLSQYLRSNPYVCTPSGFGQKARCYTRGLKQPNV